MTLRVVACRKARGTPEWPVVSCYTCPALIEISPNAKEPIATGAIPMCNPCAAEFADKAAAMGKLDGITQSTDVKAFLATGRRGSPAGEHLAALADMFPLGEKK